MCYLRVVTSPAFRFVILVNLILDCVISCACFLTASYFKRFNQMC